MSAVDLADALEGIVGKNAERQEVTCFLDTGFKPFNKILGGSYRSGLPCGRLVEMYGGSSCGKTAIATHAMAHAQKLGGIAAFMDHENSFDVGLARERMGLDTSRAWVYKTPETFEESIDTAVRLMRGVREKKLIAPEAPIIIVFDSLASMVPQSKMYDAKGEERDTESYNMHDNTALARCTSAAFPALAKQLAKYNTLGLFLNQTRTKPGVAYGDPTTTPGGQAPEFYASVRIQLTRSMLKEDKSDSKRVSGQEIRAFTKKNKVTAPFQEVSWRFVFNDDGTGEFDTVRSTIEYMKGIGLLKASGPRIEFEGKSYFIGQLADMIRQEGRLEDLNELLYATEA